MFIAFAFLLVLLKTLFRLRLFYFDVYLRFDIVINFLKLLHGEMFSWGLCFWGEGRIRVIYINDNDHKVRSNQGCYEEDE